MTDRHEPTDLGRQQVRALSGFGMTQEQISKFLGIGAKALRNYYREELDNGMAVAIAGAAKRLYAQVERDNLTAIIFYLKTKGGFRERGDEAELKEGIEPPKVIRRVIVKSKEEAQRLEALIEQNKMLSQSDEDKPTIQ